MQSSLAVVCGKKVLNGFYFIKIFMSLINIIAHKNWEKRGVLKTLEGREWGEGKYYSKQIKFGEKLI